MARQGERPRFNFWKRQLFDPARPLQYFFYGILFWACMCVLFYPVMDFIFRKAIVLRWSKVGEKFLDGLLAGLIYMSLQWIAWKRRKLVA